MCPGYSRNCARSALFTITTIRSRGGAKLKATIYGPQESQEEIWTYIEHDGDGISPVSLELLSKAHELGRACGWRVTALILGSEVEAFTEDARIFGADEVWVVEHPQLKNFDCEAFTTAANQVILSAKPGILLFGATPNGRDLAGRLAVRLRTGLNADCTQLHIDKDRGVLISEVTGFGGGVLADLEIPSRRPQMATVRPGVFLPTPMKNKDQGEIRRFNPDIPDTLIRTRILENVLEEGVDLTKAEVLICGGRGIEGRFDALAQLAEIWGGEVGATRPPVDDGFMPRQSQIGQTGVICRPKVAVNFGISGAFHFIVGIQEADLVISVNIDPDAPIFEYSDYCIQADVHELMPLLLQEFQQQAEHHE